MSIARLKLHHFPMTRSARVKWLLHELLDEDFDVERVDLYQGGQHRPEFLRMNPNHAVPVLEVAWRDGQVQTLIESAAMVTFLADAWPEKGLAPPPGPSPQRADYLQMLHFGSTWMDMMLWQIRCHEHLLPESQRDEATVRRYRAKFANEVEPQIEARLEQGPFICGEAFTAADCVVGHSVNWARGYGLCQSRAFQTYGRRLSLRPAFRQAFSDAGGFTIAPPADSPLPGQFTG